MDFQWIYIITYLLAASWIIFGVGNHLFKNGAPFIESLYQEEGLALYINRMLLTGYYLINLGYAVYKLIQAHRLASWSDLIGAWAEQIGLLCLVLGSIHYCNLIALTLFAKNKFES